MVPLLIILYLFYNYIVIAFSDHCVDYVDEVSICSFLFVFFCFFVRSRSCLFVFLFVLVCVCSLLFFYMFFCVCLLLFMFSNLFQHLLANANTCYHSLTSVDNVVLYPIVLYPIVLYSIVFYLVACIIF